MSVRSLVAATPLVSYEPIVQKAKFGRTKPRFSVGPIDHYAGLNPNPSSVITRALSETDGAEVTDHNDIDKATEERAQDLTISAAQPQFVVPRMLCVFATVYALAVVILS